MKYFVLILLFFSIVPLKGQVVEMLQIKVTDTKNMPIYGVYVIKQPGNFLLNYTDENGVCTINPAPYKSDDKIILYSMGFISDTLTVYQLKSSSLSIKLKEKIFQLEEVKVSRQEPTLSEIIKKATDQIAKIKHRGRHWEPRYYGKGVFSKLTFCKGRPVQVRREIGTFITSGNARKEVNGYDWDMAYGLYFMPEYSARSFDFTNNGQDTLKRKYISIDNEAKRNLNYDVACFPKIYNTMRALYLFGPVFSSPKYFHYKLIDETDTTYIISFATNKLYYPKPNKVLSKGTVEIDKSALRLKRMDIKHFADERFAFTMNKTYRHPYQKKLNVQFAYFKNEECYIQNCTLEIQWLYENSRSKKIGSSEGCPRPYAARDQLIEKENWKSYEYHPIPEITGATNKQLEDALCGVRFVPEGKYDKKIFDALPTTNEFREAEQILGKFTDIHEQYKKNSHKAYIQRNNYTAEDIKKRIAAKYSILKALSK